MPFDLIQSIDPATQRSANSTIAEEWQRLAAAGWQLVSVIACGNGDRIAYFQRPVAGSAAILAAQSSPQAAPPSVPVTPKKFKR